MREAKKKRIAIINTGGDEAVDKDRGSMSGEGGTETVNVAKVEVCRPGNFVYVRLKGEGGVEDDTQTLDLRGGGD